MRTGRMMLLAVPCATLVAAVPTAAQEKSLKDQLGEFSADLSMPASPAAAHVGLSAESVLMPRNRREFEAGVSNVFKGTGKPTGALEFAPHYIFRGGKLQFTRYRDDSVFRALTKTTLGLASGTREIGGAEVGARGISLSSVLIDLGDPIYSLGLQQCINQVQKGMLERAKGAALAEGEELPESGSRTPFQEADRLTDDQAVGEYKACIAKREPQLWNRSRLSVGLAGGRGREADAPARRIRFGTGVWVSAQYGFEDWAALRRLMGSGPRYYDCDEVAPNGSCRRPHEPSRLERHASLTLHARRTNGASDLDLSQVGELRRTDSRLFGARFTYGSQTRSVFLEASRSSLKGSGVDKRTDQHALGASLRVSENLWVNAVSGRRKLYSDGRLEDVVELQFQYGASSEPLVVPRN